MSRMHAARTNDKNVEAGNTVDAEVEFNAEVDADVKDACSTNVCIVVCMMTMMEMLWLMERTRPRPTTMLRPETRPRQRAEPSSNPASS